MTALRRLLNEAATSDEAARRDGLGSAKGIMLAVAVSATIWGVVVLTALMPSGL